LQKNKALYYQIYIFIYTYNNKSKRISYAFLLYVKTFFTVANWVRPKWAVVFRRRLFSPSLIYSDAHARNEAAHGAQHTQPTLSMDASSSSRNRPTHRLLIRNGLDLAKAAVPIASMGRGRWAWEGHCRIVDDGIYGHHGPRRLLPLLRHACDSTAAALDFRSGLLCVGIGERFPGLGFDVRPRARGSSWRRWWWRWLWTGCIYNV
jgi:hypothetical protein